MAQKFEPKKNPLKPDQRMDVRCPGRPGRLPTGAPPRHWREGRGEERQIGDFTYYETSKPVKAQVPPSGSRLRLHRSVPDCVNTTEIASGRFEDDLRRLRMAAWNGADHLMVIRTAGQSHIDSLLTTRRDRRDRRHLQAVPRHAPPPRLGRRGSGPSSELPLRMFRVSPARISRVMFVEEGVSRVHQDPQYNVLYRNINMLRSFIDACNRKRSCLRRNAAN